MTNKKFILGISIIPTILLMFALTFFIATALSIGNSVKDNCNKAQNQFEGDCVNALMQTIEADFATNVNKNSAVWALGQLGDDRALPLLESKFTGEIS